MSGFLGVMQAASVVVELAEKNPDVVVVSQDLGPLGEFTPRFPERHFDVGISEQNLVGVAAGLAHAGRRPFVLAMAPFLSMRGFEQIRDDCAYNRRDVVFLAPFSGLEAGPWGATHHAIEDIALLRVIPGLTLLAPADPAESARAVRAAAETEGPVYVRLGAMSPIGGYDVPFAVGGSAQLRDGDDIAILATGGLVQAALGAQVALAAKGIAARVVNIYSLKPLDRACVERCARETGHLVTVEEHSIHGGLGGAVAEILAELGAGRLARVGVRDVFCTEIAPHPDLLRIHGLDAGGIETAALELLGP
jgi:transketolase